MDSEGKMQRYFHLDFARALAILLVTGFHVWRFQGEPASLVDAVLAKGYAGVDLFFVISGYAMMLTYQRIPSTGFNGTLTFWKSRLLRIYPSYIVALAFWAVMVRQGVAVKSAGTYDIVAHLLMLHTFDAETFFSVSGVFWSLAVETHFYILFPFLMRLASKFRLSLAIISLLLTAALDFWLMGKNAAEVVPLRWNVFTFLPLFLLGMELHAYQAAPKHARSLFSAYTILIVVGALTIAESFYPATASQPASPLMLNRILIGAVLGFLCLACLPKAVPKNVVTRLISLVGIGSYSIYLFNYIFWMLGTPVVDGNLGIIVTSSGVVVFGILMWVLVEQPFEAIRHKLNRRES
jgi:peptidoglycan/LPS O-acetylase OafA/YrhL